MKILITGFSGTLGSAFTEYNLSKGNTVVGIDNNEWAVASFPDHENLTKLLGDFQDHIGYYDLIIHCAAYKHVDLIESNRESALENNVYATGNLYDNTTGEVLFISTDKAVEPASYYGETKLAGEKLTKERDGVIARLGNILSSTGSVIPKWEKAIAESLPIPITDFTMTRYLITARNAVECVMTLYNRAESGQVIIPEMGEPKPILDLLEEVLHAHGTTLQKYKPGTKVIGIRPGEKLHEKLKWDTEKTVYQDINGIIVSNE